MGRGCVRIHLRDGLVGRAREPPPRFERLDEHGIRHAPDHHEIVGGDTERVAGLEHPVDVLGHSPGIDLVQVGLFRVPVGEVPQHLRREWQIQLVAHARRIEEPALHRVPIVRVAMLGVEETWLEIEPRVELDPLLDAPPRTTRKTEAGGQLALELCLHRRPMELRVMVSADDVNEISLLEKTGERVKDLRVARERLAQLPDALRLVGTEPELALLFAHGEAGVIGRASHRSQRLGCLERAAGPAESRDLQAQLHRITPDAEQAARSQRPTL